MPVHVGGGVRGEEDGRAHRLVGPAPAPQGDAPAELGGLGPAEERRVHVGEEESGAMALAVMPWGPSSTASARIKALSPPLEAV